MRFRALSSLLACLLGAVACGGEDDGGPPSPQAHRVTYRLLGGISMGAIGTGTQGPTHADRFDGLGMLGGPLDAAMLLRLMDHQLLGGGCSREALEGLLKENPASLNDPAAIDACARKAVTLRPYEHNENVNRWVYALDAQFDRRGYLELFQDLTLAFGNLLSENPDSPFAPPGVPVDVAVSPPEGSCASPVRVKGYLNAEYNPDGLYDAITFCDGSQDLWFCQGTGEAVDFCAAPANRVTPVPRAQEQAYALDFCAQKGGAVNATEAQHPLRFIADRGRFDGCREQSRPARVALALDMNGNGRRDYGEPILNNGEERYADVGTDGCANAREDGEGGCGEEGAAPPGVPDPNGDDYEPVERPFGTEADGRWEEGEPFRDDGLDGVPGTADVGEGNGAFDLSSGRRKLYAHDARSNLAALPRSERERLRVLLDGGVRDIFQFGLMAQAVYGVRRSDDPENALAVRDFTELPGMTDERTGRYKPFGKRWDELVEKDLFILYGKDPAVVTDAERIAAEGGHVGTREQALDRVFTFFNWAAAHWPELERPETPLDGSTFTDRTRHEWFDSAALRGKRDYSVFLPPGYDTEVNRDARYPVVYLLHGYGQTPRDFIASALVADAYMSDPSVRLRPMILVYASGTCCSVETATGQRDCRERDEAGARISDRPGWTRECNRGSFYVDRSGYSAGDAAGYGESLFELMDVIDQRYRTLPPAERAVPPR